MHPPTIHIRSASPSFHLPALLRHQLLRHLKPPPLLHTTFPLRSTSQQTSYFISPGLHDRPPGDMYVACHSVQDSQLLTINALATVTFLGRATPSCARLAVLKMVLPLVFATLPTTEQLINGVFALLLALLGPFLTFYFTNPSVGCWTFLPFHSS